ncbi:unnamed protein product, partial [Ixodes pacificus]
PDASNPVETAPTLKREVGLFSAIAVLIGMTIGSGIFTTPSIVFRNAGSAGVALLIWCLAGFKALIEVLCYAELATLLPAAGGSYAYITAGSRSLGRYGDIIPFMYAWSCMIISEPMSAAYQGLTFASYALSVVYGDCVPAYTTKLITALTFIGNKVRVYVPHLALGTALNCISVRTSARVQDVLATFKCAALVSIIVSGAVSAFRVNKLFDAPLFSGVTTASNIVRAIFAAATSYGGCSSIASLTEEITNPSRNVPLAFVTGVLILTLIYVLTNLAYFVVLDASTVASSEAIAVSFATVTWGQSAASCIPVIVSVSAFGSLCAIFFISARVELAAARQGHLPSVLSFINVNTSVPMVSLIVRGSFSLLYTFAGSLTFIIDSISLVVSVNEIFTMISFFVLRSSMKNVPRPFCVATVIPVLYLATLVTLIVGSLVNPSSYFQYIVVFVGYFTGGAYYVVFVRLKTNFPGGVMATAFVQKLSMCVPC